jgi:hypothetical protein
MRHSIGFAVVAAMVALGACGGDGKEAGGVTAEEAAKLNEISETLDASPDSLVAEDETGLGNGEDLNAGVSGQGDANAQ